jgi:hypothetical protein
VTRKVEAVVSVSRLISGISVLIGVAALAQAPAGNKLYASAHLKRSTVYASASNMSFLPPVTIASEGGQVVSVALRT